MLRRNLCDEFTLHVSEFSRYVPFDVYAEDETHGWKNVVTFSDYVALLSKSVKICYQIKVKAPIVFSIHLV